MCHLSAHAGRCRHRSFPEPGTTKFPDTCLAGVKYADVRIGEHGPFWDREPCHERGRANGATCPKLDVYSDEEVAAYEAELTAHLEQVQKSLDERVCATCGTKVHERGSWYFCERGCLAVHVNRGRHG